MSSSSGCGLLGRQRRIGQTVPIPGKGVSSWHINI